jgi:hypothetical protein
MWTINTKENKMNKGIIIAIIGSAIAYNIFGGVGLLIAVGIGVIGETALLIIGSRNFLSRSPNVSYGVSITDHVENRRKYPNKCISCTYYLSRGVCRQTGQPVSPMDSCSNWC